MTRRTSVGFDLGALQLLILLFTSGVLSYGAYGCKEREAAPSVAALPPLVTRSHPVMGTQLTISIQTEDEAHALEAVRAVFSEFDRIERLMSVWVPGSDIERINRSAAKEPVRVSAEVIEILKRARSFSESTGGKFDVSFGALSGLWRFDHDQDNKIPSPEDVKARLPLIAYESILIDDKGLTVRLAKDGMRLHLGGIAKGYAVDRGVLLLRNAGFSAFMIQAGGDMYVAGKRGTRPWHVGIRDPRGGPSDYFAFAEVLDSTFSTSGDYERYFIADGKRYHHIIDPDTGEPARRCRSVTVMAPSAEDADALSTSIFLLGAEEGFKLLERFDRAGAVVVDADNKVHISPFLEGRVKLLRDPTP